MPPKRQEGVRGKERGEEAREQFPPPPKVAGDINSGFFLGERGECFSKAPLPLM